MPQVVDARRAMAAAVDPAELATKIAEHAVDLAISDGMPQQLPAAGDEERQLGRGAHMAGAMISVALQCLDGARMQRHQPCLAELALPDRSSRWL